MIYPAGSTSVSFDVQVVDDSGLPVTGLVAATFPALFYSLAGAHATVAFPALSDLATITTAYHSGGIKERSGGYYRVDGPNAMFITAGQVKVFGESSGKRVLVPWIDVGSQINLAAGSFDLSTMTGSALLGLGVNSVVCFGDGLVDGAIAVVDTYYYAGIFNFTPYYRGITNGLFISNPAGSFWAITSVLGVNGSGPFTYAGNAPNTFIPQINGSYTASGTATGSATVYAQNRYVDVTYIDGLNTLNIGAATDAIRIGSYIGNELAPINADTFGAVVIQAGSLETTVLSANLKFSAANMWLSFEGPATLGSGGDDCTGSYYAYGIARDYPRFKSINEVFFYSFSETLNGWVIANNFNDPPVGDYFLSSDGDAIVPTSFTGHGTFTGGITETTLWPDVNNVWGILKHGGGSGSGAYVVNIKVTSNGTTPIVGASVRISGLQTAFNVSDVNGIAALSLDAGTVTLSATAPGYTFNPVSEVITGSATITITMTLVPAPTPSPDPAKTNVYFTARKADLTKAVGVTFKFYLVNPLALVDAWSTLQEQDAVTDGNGLCQILLAINTEWRITGPDGTTRTFISGSGTTFALPEFVGKF
jgi:hypothetical protein